MSSSLPSIPPRERSEWEDGMKTKGRPPKTIQKHRPRSRRATPVDTRVDDSCSRHSNLRQAGAERRDAAPVSDKERGKKLNSSDVLAVSSISSSRSVSTLVKVASALSATVQSQHSKIPTHHLVYWSSLSVRAAIAVIEAKGSETVAQKAANAVLKAGEKKRPASKSSLRTLATKVSVVVLEAGGGHNVAAAVVVAIMNSEHDDGDSKSNSSSISSSSSREMIRSKNNRGTSSVTPSTTAVRRQLKEKEDEITQKKRALEEAELLNMERERAISERMAALDAATAAMMEKIDNIQDGIGRRIESIGTEEGDPDSGQVNSPPDNTFAMLEKIDNTQDGIGRRIASKGMKEGDPDSGQINTFAQLNGQLTLSKGKEEADPESGGSNSTPGCPFTQLKGQLSLMFSDSAREGRPALASPMKRSNYW